VLFEQTMTDTAPFADVLLPATTFLEHYDIARGYGAYHFQLTQPVIAPVGEARPNQEVFRELRARLGQVEPVTAEEDLGEAGALMELSARLPASLGPAVARGQQSEPPGGSRPVQFVDVLPKTADRRAHLFPSEIAPSSGLYTYHAVPATALYPLSLISPASEHTISSTLGELRPGVARLKMHPDDAHPRSITDGCSVRVFNDLGDVHCEVSITPEICAGAVSLPKGLWARSTFNGATANALVPDSLSDIGGGACFNDARVNVELLARH
jgi:anaerobic selenocysteine-containing dehydrogenase